MSMQTGSAPCNRGIHVWRVPRVIRYKSGAKRTEGLEKGGPGSHLPSALHMGRAGPPGESSRGLEERWSILPSVAGVWPC